MLYTLYILYLNDELPLLVSLLEGLMLYIVYTVYTLYLNDGLPLLVGLVEGLMLYIRYRCTHCIHTYCT